VPLAVSWCVSKTASVNTLQTVAEEHVLHPAAQGVQVVSFSLNFPSAQVAMTAGAEQVAVASAWHGLLAHDPEPVESKK
jgi:hypothetical protein